MLFEGKLFLIAGKLWGASAFDTNMFANDERTQFMKQRVAGMETVASAMKQLYVVLTPQQKEILDARFGQDMPM